jgi:cysteine-rich repeat protein
MTLIIVAGCPTDDAAIDGVCGDGNQDSSEQCDDGNLVSNDSCTDLCQTATCGDGIVHLGNEACDDGNTIDTDACPSTCQAAACGDGFLRTDLAEGEPGFERCDDGNTELGDGCNSNCQPGLCGNGVVDSELGEACDDANEISTDGCIDCQLARCGDGHIQAGEELCDDNNNSDFDGCTNTCEPARCGDGIVRNDLDEGDEGFEVCDDGNDSDLDECTSDCVAATCGDGFIHAGVEECDDGNLVDADACRDTCTSAQCGDGVLRLDLAEGEDGYENCDDGNTEPSDACTDLCLRASCGDGRVRRDIVDIDADDFEACDDGNDDSSDACLNTCRVAQCGDLITRTDLAEGDEGYESCDDGNQVNTDACADCALARCGDGIVRNDIQTPGQDGWEDCDDGNIDSGDNCSTNCFAEANSISVGPYHSCATTHEGPAYCWGYGTRGQLGNGAETTRNTPVRVNTPSVFEAGQGGGPGREISTHFTQIAVGAYHTCGVVAEGGHVLCWGWNNQGQRGHGQRSPEFRNIPTATPDTANTVSLALGSYHSCAIDQRGSFSCWGQNQYGQLGLGDTTNRYAPDTLSGSRGGGLLTMGPYTTCSRTSRDVQCFGSNAGYPMHPNSGGQEIGYDEPVTVTQAVGSRDFSIGGNGHACEVSNTFGLDCWGSNSAGQVNPASQNTGRQIRRTIINNISKVSLGHSHSCALTTQRTVKCWGGNVHGQLGRLTRGTTRQAVDLVSGLTAAVEVDSGEFSTCARDEDNAVWCWGKNNYGQLGDGTTDQRNTPVHVELY